MSVVALVIAPSIAIVEDSPAAQTESQIEKTIIIEDQEAVSFEEATETDSEIKVEGEESGISHIQSTSESKEEFVSTTKPSGIELKTHS
jgi:hypothetical protein